MGNDPYIQVNPMVRIYESSLLSVQQIQRLVDSTWYDCLEQLKTSVYAKYIAKSDFKLNYSSYLLDYQLSVIEEFKDIVPDMRIIHLFMLRYTYHNVKMIMKSNMVKEDYSMFCIDEHLYKISELEDAILHQKSDVIHPILMEAIISSSTEVQGSKSLGIDIILDRYYLKDIVAIAEEIQDVDILNYVKSTVDVYNLEVCFRAMKQQRELHYIEAILSSHGWLSIGELKQACSDEASMKSFLKESEYASLVDDKDMYDLELYNVKANEYLSSLLDQSQFNSFGPLPLMALFYAHEKQRKNIQLILSLKQSGMKSEQLAKRILW